MNRRALLIAVAGMFTTASLRAQVGADGSGQPGPPATPYQPRGMTTPAVPPVNSQPTGWLNSPAGAVQPAAPEPDLNVAFSEDPKELPEKFLGTEMVARVGTEVIMASECLPGVEETVQKALASGQLPEQQATMLRYHLMKQRLEGLVETKLLYIEARREIPKENMDKIKKKVREVYDKEQIPKLIDGVKIKSRAELLKAMKDAGTSMEEQQRQFLERSLASQYVHKQVGDEKEITHEEMLAYYRAHLKDYETLPRARWEHVMVQFSNYPSKGEAHAKIAGWGNEIFSGVPMAEVAKKHSDDLSSENGGLHDWTTQGSLASEVLDTAIFTLPVGTMSPIMEDKLGFHIVRVVERNDLTRKPFGEVQAEIKKKIKADREGLATKEFIAKLRKKIRVWTIFDDQEAVANRAAAPARR